MNTIILSDKVFTSFFQVVVVSIRIDIHFLNDLFPCFPLNVMLKNKSSLSPFPKSDEVIDELLVIERHFIRQKIKVIGFFLTLHQLELTE
nr:MAG TPA: hypothetical protein [Caudoviricetes sp.]